MNGNCDSFGVFRTAPAQLYRQFYFFLLLYFRHKPFVMNYFLVSFHYRLLYAAVLIIRIFYFKTESAAVSELIECKACKPFGLFVFDHITEFLYHFGLLIGSRYIAVRIEFSHGHGLCFAVIQKLEAFKARFCHIKGIFYGIPFM